jgi:hypothetical protein
MKRTAEFFFLFPVNELNNCSVITEKRIHVFAEHEESRESIFTSILVFVLKYVVLVSHPHVLVLCLMYRKSKLTRRPHFEELRFDLRFKTCTESTGGQCRDLWFLQQVKVVWSPFNGSDSYLLTRWLVCLGYCQNKTSCNQCLLLIW